MSEWKERMALLRPWLSRFKRRFSVLDLGCGDGQVSSAIAEEFDVTVVTIDPELDSGYENTPRTICLKKKFNAHLLAGLADCEHFDVVLALNFLHHFDQEWEAAAEAVLRMGWHVFVQLPKVGQERVAGETFIQPLTAKIQGHGAVLLGEAPHVSWERHLPRPLWLVRNENLKLLPRFSMHGLNGRPQNSMEKTMKVLATYDNIECYRLDKGNTWRSWIVGMNLFNVAVQNCTHPTKQRIAEQVRAYPLPAVPHGDVIPWNFIYDGDALYLIDPASPIRREDQFGLKKVAEFMEMEKPEWTG